MLPPDYFPIQKSFQYMIEREHDCRLRSLEEMIVKLKREVAELRCIQLPVTVSVSRIKQISTFSVEVNPLKKGCWFFYSVCDSHLQAALREIT